MNVLQHTRNELNLCLKENRPDRSYRDTLLNIRVDTLRNPNLNSNKYNNARLALITAIPSDNNTSTKVSEKRSKYKDLEIEITRMWQMKTEIIPVVIGALGVIKKGSEKVVREILGNINPWEIQKTMGKVLSIKWQ